MSKKASVPVDGVMVPIVEPHPAEDLSADDDLLSWILVDQLGALPNTRLGVHPQQVKFVGPSFKNEEIMDIVRETVTQGDITGAMQRLQEWNLIAAHLQEKMTEGQRERFIQHLRRYLLPLMPTSRVEVFTTPRYSAVTKHTELAVFATRPLAPGVVLQELQGSVVPLPDAWREEMEIGEDFAYRAAEEEDDYSDSEAEGSEDEESNTNRDKGKAKERDSESRNRGARRSDRTKRRDFSIVWSGLKRCFQLFLGPARFLNHDCVPNVELLRQGKYVTFRVSRHIRIGEEITAFYGDSYFGKNNIECLCLTCEQNQRGGFTPKEESRNTSRSRSRDSSATPQNQAGPSSSRPSRPSALRNMLTEDANAIASTGDNTLTSRNSTPGPSRLASNRSNGDVDEEVPQTPRSPEPSQREVRNGSARPDDESAASDSEPEIESPKRERSKRLAAKKIKPWAFLKRPREILKAMQEAGGILEPAEEDEDLPEDFPRCGTCAKALHERVWYANRYFDHCPRCIRHALIFCLPWPAHRPQDVMEYPPSHLTPNGYMPKRISYIPLPTLSKKKPEPIAIPLEQPAEKALSKEQRRQCEFRNAIEVSEYLVGLLRNEAWSAQDTEEQAIIARSEAIEAAARRKEEARLRKLEEKRKKDENKIKGTGVWSRYEYVSAEEMERRIEERKTVTSGTRRGGRSREAEEEERLKRLAEEQQKKEERKRKRKEKEDQVAREASRLASSAMNIDGQDEGFIPPPSPPIAGPSNYMVDTPRSTSYPDDADTSITEVLRMVEPHSSANSPNDVSSDRGELADKLVQPSAPTRPLKTLKPKKRNSVVDSASASEASDAPKRGKGRPPGTGKWQKMRALELARAASGEGSAGTPTSTLKDNSVRSHPAATVRGSNPATSFGSPIDGTASTGEVIIAAPLQQTKTVLASNSTTGVGASSGTGKMYTTPIKPRKPRDSTKPARASPMTATTTITTPSAGAAKTGTTSPFVPAPPPVRHAIPRSSGSAQKQIRPYHVIDISEFDSDNVSDSDDGIEFIGMSASKSVSASAAKANVETPIRAKVEGTPIRDRSVNGDGKVVSANGAHTGHARGTAYYVEGKGKGKGSVDDVEDEVKASGSASGSSQAHSSPAHNAASAFRPIPAPILAAGDRDAKEFYVTIEQGKKRKRVSDEVETTSKKRAFFPVPRHSLPAVVSSASVHRPTL